MGERVVVRLADEGKVPGIHRVSDDPVLLEQWEENGGVVDEELIILAREFGAEPSVLEFLESILGERVGLIPVVE